MSLKAFLSSLLVAALAAAVPVIAAAEEKAPGPADPASPTADFGGRAEPQSWVRAVLVKARGERLEGELLLSFTSLPLPAEGSGDAKARSAAPSEIVSIEFTRWQGRLRRKNEYMFHPVRVRVTLTDRSVIESRVTTASLYRLRFRTGSRVRTLHSCFFDYREKDAWKGSGKKDVAYPETNPHGDTVVRIELAQEQGAGPLDAIIRMLQKR